MEIKPHNKKIDKILIDATHWGVSIEWAQRIREVPNYKQFLPHYWETVVNNKQYKCKVVINEFGDINNHVLEENELK